MRMMPWAVRVMVGTEHGHLHLLLMKSAEGLGWGLREGEGSEQSAEDLLPGEQGSIGLVVQDKTTKGFSVGHSKPRSLSVCLCFD